MARAGLGPRSSPRRRVKGEGPRPDGYDISVFQSPRTSFRKHLAIYFHLAACQAPVGKKHIQYHILKKMSLQEK